MSVPPPHVEITYEVDFDTIKTGLYYVAPTCTYLNYPMTPDELVLVGEGYNTLLIFEERACRHKSFLFLGYEIHYVKRGIDSHNLWLRVVPLPLTIEQRLSRIEKKLGLS